MKFQLQSIQLPTIDLYEIEELYYHKNGRVVCFDGYFNLFYIEKRKVYTGIDNLELQLTLKGYDNLTLMHNENVLSVIQLNADENKKYIMDFPYNDYNSGVFWFYLTESGSVAERNVSGFFITELTEDKIRPINIGIDICTYKREENLIRNLKQIEEEVIKNSTLDVFSHLFIYLIDNSKTLEDNTEIKKLIVDYESDLKVYPNKNTGGAGGFTRGMLEILKARDERGLTHVLLMDDDVIVEPDAFVRIYGFLATLKDEWKDMTVGGEMLREEQPYMLYCAGEYWKSAYSYNPCKDTDLREFKNATKLLLTETGHEHEWYSGWWLCCYSLNTVREDNLPLPLFLHHDDIEYGLRNRDKGIVFLNGICVWHKVPDEVNAGVNTYYDIRNGLIEISLNEKESKRYRTAVWVLLKSISHSVATGHYVNAKLAYQGFIDFLKGPDWLSKQDPEKIDRKIRKEYSNDRKGILSIYRKTIALFIRYFKPASKNWNENADKLATKDFWEEYMDEEL